MQEISNLSQQALSLKSQVRRKIEHCRYIWPRTVESTFSNFERHQNHFLFAEVLFTYIAFHQTKRRKTIAALSLSPWQIIWSAPFFPEIQPFIIKGLLSTTTMPYPCHYLRFEFVGRNFPIKQILKTASLWKWLSHQCILNTTLITASCSIVIYPPYTHELPTSPFMPHQYINADLSWLSIELSTPIIKEM